MGTIELQPTLGEDVEGSSWYDPRAALRLDEYSAQSLGGGLLVLRECYGRSRADNRHFIGGFELHLRAKAVLTPLSLDTFTASAGTLLREHDGETDADWQRPTTSYKPTDLKVNSSGRLYFTFENEDGYSSNGSEHFLTNLVPGTSDYSVEAVFYAASIVGTGAKAEVYARATQPHRFYFLQYEQGAGWKLGSKTVSGDRTTLASYVGDEIALGTSKTAKLAVEGSLIKGYVDGVERLSVTNTTVSGPGYGGLRIDAPSSMSEPKVTVTALYDLGSAQRVTRYRLRFGTVNNNTWPNALEASNDGETWVNAAGIIPPQGIGSGVFFWESEWDSSSVTSTHYRYWRAVVYDGGTPVAGEARIADFRLYDSGGSLITPGGSVSVRYTYRQGSSAGTWSEAASTSLLADGSPGSNSTYVGGLPPYDYDLKGLQVDRLRIDRIYPSHCEAGLTVNGETVAGSLLPVELDSDFSDVVVGGSGELFGRAWEASDVDSALFGITLKRSGSGIELFIDSARVIMYYTPGGGFINMVPRELAQQQIVIGHEPAFGDDVASTIRLRNTRIEPIPNAEFMVATAAGEKLSTDEIVVAEMADGAISGIATYDEIGYLLASIIGRPKTVALEGTDAYRHTFTFDNRKKNARNSYNLEYGDMNRAHKVKALLVAALSLTQQTKSIDLGGSIIAGKLSDGIVPSRGAASVQTLTQSGSGTFKLGYRGEFTTALTAGSSLTAADIQAALRALGGISSTQLTVTGSDGGPFTITFGNAASGPFQGFPQPILDVLVASGTPTASVANTTAGGFVTHEGHVINPRHLSVYLTDVLADIATSKLSGAFVNSFSLANFFTPVWENDRAKESYSGYVESPAPEVKFGATLNADSNGMSWLPKGRSNTLLFKRLEWIGGAIGSTSYFYKLQIDSPVKVSGFGPYGEEQDAYAFEYEFTAKQDDSTGRSVVIILENQVASYLGS